MASLRIPESDYPGLAALLSLKEEPMNELLSALADAPDVSDANELAEIISTKAKTIPLDIAKIVARVIISLSYGRVLLDYTASAFAKAVCDAMEETGLEMLKLGTERAKFENNLVKILSIDSLNASIKAQAVLHEYEHIICNARVLTDLRPVFGSGSVDVPVGMGIVHTLRIRYHESESVKEFFVAMDGEELQELREILERAGKKEKSLKSILEKAGIYQIET
jgi:hypothetical protein